MRAFGHSYLMDSAKTPSVERQGERKPKLPDSVWVRFNRQVAPLLVEKRVDGQPLLQFFHRQLADIARAALRAGQGRPARRPADYFDAHSKGRQ
jgi:hypothetical protein